MTRIAPALLLLITLAACASDGPTVVDPPPSRADAPDTPPADTPDPVSDVSDVPDAATDEDAAAELDAGPAPADAPVGGPDAGPPIGNGAVGEPCFLDDQCDNDGLCLDWPQGYCTALNCPVVAECPEGSSCVTLGTGTTVCLSECHTQADCRDEYGCKPFVDVDGAPASGCVGLGDDPAPAGGACEEHTDCEGPFACLTFVPEGYCALIGCGAGTCPGGTACVTYNGQATCLKTCATTEECLVAGAEKRTCAPLLDTDLKVAQVCIPATDGIGVGSGCSLDIECESNECRIVAEGKCVSSDLGCFTDADCPGAGVCELAPAYVKGVCTQACADDLACPGNSLCVDALSGLAWCQLSCKGLGDFITCEKPLGEACVFGDPVASTTGGGKYACVVLKSGDPGTDCAEEEDCKGGGCLGAPGTCASPCGDDFFCPFPTTCVDHGGALRCMKRCFSVQDCPGSLACKSTAGSPQKICVP